MDILALENYIFNSHGRSFSLAHQGRRGGSAANPEKIHRLPITLSCSGDKRRGEALSRKVEKMAWVSAKTKIPAWIKILRLHFYPMTWVAYTLGAVAASICPGPFNLPAYGLGYIVLFLVEGSTIMVNEYFDYPTDFRNRNAGPFTGGTRVLVEGRLGFREVRRGILISGALAVGFALLLVRYNPGGSPSSIIFLLLLGLFLGYGYTAPPLQFSYRGLGEIVVGLTHSPYVILCGYIFQGGSWKDFLPWLLSAPLFFATLAAIILAGIPDRQADEETSKRGLAVILGPRRAVILASSCVVIAALMSVLFWPLRPLEGVWGKTMVLIILHGSVLLWALMRFLQSANYDRKIDGLLTLALSYIVWFGLIPLFSFIWSNPPC